MLPQRRILAQALGLNALDNLLRLGDKAVQLLVTANVQVVEAREELLQIADGRIAKDLGFAVLLPSEPLGEMADQLG